MNTLSERINRDIAEYGFGVVEVPAAPRLNYSYHYTVGLYRLGFSEILVSNGDSQTAIDTINRIVSIWREEKLAWFDETLLDSLPALIPLHTSYMVSYMPEMFSRLPDTLPVRKPVEIVQALLLGNPRDVFKTRR